MLKSVLWHFKRFRYFQIIDVKRIERRKVDGDGDGKGKDEKRNHDESSYGEYFLPQNSSPLIIRFGLIGLSCHSALSLIAGFHLLDAFYPPRRRYGHVLYGYDRHAYQA